MTSLLPPLEVISDNLFGSSDEVLQQWAEGVCDIPSDTIARSSTEERALKKRMRGIKTVSEEIEETPPIDEAIELPAFLVEMIDHRITTQNQISQELPKPGQILCIEEVVGKQGDVLLELAFPIGVLLDRPTDRSQSWHGWVVSYEVDYASEWDVLLEDADQPFDPLVQMVQAWNPVEINVLSSTAVLAELRKERLEAIRTLAGEYAMRGQHDIIRAFPGSVMDRYVGDNFRLLTGTPLGGDEDPRWRYQSLYKKAAEMINQTAASVTTRSSLFDRLIGHLTESARILGESLIAKPLVPQALGTESSKTQVFELENIARLEIYPPPSDKTLQVRVEILGDHRIEASVSTGDLTLQSEILNPEHPKADFFLTVGKQTLRMIDATGKKRLEWTPNNSD